MVGGTRSRPERRWGQLQILRRWRLRVLRLLAMLLMVELLEMWKAVRTERLRGVWVLKRSHEYGVIGGYGRQHREVVRNWCTADLLLLCARRPRPRGRRL